MAKKTVQVVEEQPQEQVLGPYISYDDLVSSRVIVEHKDGVKYYLDPATKQGMFILRIVQQPAHIETQELPAEWKRPTKEEAAAAANKIDWETPSDTKAEEEPSE